MNAWTSGVFGSVGAAAAEFVDELRAMSGPEVGDKVVGAVRAVTVQGEAYLLATTVVEGLAALTLLAAPQHPELLTGARDPEAIREWWHHVDLDITPALQLAGRAALSRIAVPADNEWFETWCDDEGMLPVELVALLHRLSEAYA